MDRLIIFTTFALLAHVFCNINAQSGVYKPLGCWTDKAPERAMTNLEGKSDALKVHYKRRDNPIEKCYTAAIENKMPIFGVQDDGQCFGSANKEIAQKYGSSSACSSGTGGPLANNVYELTTLAKCLCLIPAEHKDAIPAGKLCFDGLSSVNSKKRTALHIAARYGKHKCVKTLIAKGANVEALDADKKTPIQLAQWKSEELGCGSVVALVNGNAVITHLDNAERARVTKCMKQIENQS